MNKESDSEFVTKSWNSASDQSHANYSIENEIIYSIEVLKSNTCDYNDVYILLRGNITIRL